MYKNTLILTESDAKLAAEMLRKGFVKLRQNQAHLRDGITLSRASA